MPNNSPTINATPETPIAPATQAGVALNSSPHPDTKCGKDCDQCLKGGMPMKREFLSFVVIVLVGLVTVLFVLFINEKRKTIVYAPTTEDTAMTQPVTYQMPAMKSMIGYVELPTVITQGQHTLNSVITTRRSRRVFAETPVALADLGQILWSAQGITDQEKGYRAAPSARSAYPFTVYAVIRNVEGVEPGLYEYLPEKHQLGYLGLANAGDMLSAAGVQAGAQEAPVVLLLAASPAKMLEKSPDGDPLPSLYLEAGHIGQNIYLQVEDLGMSTVVMAGFDEIAVGESVKLDSNEIVMYVVPLGNRSSEEEVATH